MFTRCLTAFLAFAFFAAAVSGRDDVANREIEAVLGAIARSDAQFVRNGSAYPAPEAIAHLRMKLNYAGERVKTAEDFIEGIASKSSMSGKPYLIKKPNGESEPAGPWMLRVLAAYRAGGKS